MKLGAIDIGSNAARMQISSVLHNNNQVTFKKLEYIRFPLQLGKDVFHGGSIGDQRESNLTKFVHICKLLFDLHEVTAFQACATSAMREAINGSEVARRIKTSLGVPIHIITGSQEAELINQVVLKELDAQNYIHIDVGGGSTELNIYVDHQKIAAKSFKIGSVRLLEEPEEAATQWDKIKKWITEQMPQISGEVRAVGTGGNISKLYELAKLYQFIQHPVGGLIGWENIAMTRDFITQFTTEERIHKLRLNPDRADVILPAAQIYLFVMQCAQTEWMSVPDVGLIDGIILGLYEKMKKKME